MAVAVIAPYSSINADASTTLPIQGDTPTGEEFFAERDNPENNIPGEAVLIIHSDTEWSGSILDTNFDSATIDGSGPDKIQFPCINGGTYSLAFQKQTDYGYLSLFLLQEGDAIDMKFTTADSGMVSLSGTC